jgi:peptidyl-prolyl cis-trans isomerase D
MLQAIRDRITGIVAIFVLGLLAVPFLFFGVESYIRAVPQDAVATVGDGEISTSDFQTSFARHRANLRQQQGDAYDEIATNHPIARREHLEGMIDQLLLKQQAEELGLEVTEAALFRIISDIPNFHLDGRFDPELYRQILRGTGRTPRSFERELREDLLVNALPASLSASAAITEAEVDRMIALQQEKRRVSLLEVVYQEFADQVEVSEADIATHYETETDRYLTTEQVQIAYVELNARDLTDGLDLSEDELLRRYESASQRYLTPEARRASHILIAIDGERDTQQARALAGELRLRIADGEDFAELAREYSDDPGSGAEGGDLGWVEPEQMVAPFEDALYGLDAPGDLSEPVETRFGWHVIRLEEIRPPQGMSFEEARGEILAEYIERESEALFIEMSERLVDLVFADDSTLEPLAAELGLEIRTSEPFPRTGGSGIAANQRVVEAAFSDTVLLDRIISDPIELERNQMVVIQLDEHFPAEPRPLEEVAETIRERLMRERAAELARARARELADAAGANGELLEEVAGQNELALEELEGVARFDFQHGGDFLNALFRLPAPGDQPTVHVLPRGRNFVVVRLEQVIPGNPAEATENERMSARQQLRFARMGSEVAGLLEYLRENTRIRVVEERL